jgi:hypothetical protein
VELLIGLIVVGVVLFFVFNLGAKTGFGVAKDTRNFASRDVRTAQAHDRNNLLNTYRREIANMLVWSDPDRYLEFYRTLHVEVSTYGGWKLDALQAKHDELAKQFPQYEDFDGFGTRLHVLYADTWGGWSDDLAARFADITRFQALACATYWKDSAAWFGGPTSDSDIDHLSSRYIERIKDTKLRLRIERAIDDYHVWCEGKGGTPHWDSPIEEQTFAYRNIAVRPIESFGDSRYGIHFKDTNEYGIYGFFMFDDGRTHHSYYRSDAAFQNERRLDPLGGVADAHRIVCVPHATRRQ